MLEKILIFMVFLCPLIFFHELGHFFFARLFGVRVETFSIGFGPKLFRYMKNGTEYVLSLIPLGGYIKMFGDDPLNETPMSEEDKKYAFNHKSKWARFWIVFGGPLFNFILAYFIFVFLLLSGEKIPVAKFGQLGEDSILRSKGVQPADSIVRINNVAIQGITDFGFGENENIHSVGVKRGNDPQEISIALNIPFKTFMEDFIKHPPHFRKPIMVDIRGNRYGLTFVQGKMAWDHSLEEMNAKAGGFDKAYLYRFIEVGGVNKTNADAETDTGAAGTGSGLKEGEYLVNYKVEKVIDLKGMKPNELFATIAKEGFYVHDLQVAKLAEGSAAEKAGLRANDIVVAVDSTPVYGFESLRNYLTKLGKAEAGAPISMVVKYYRNTTLSEATVYPDLTTEDGVKAYKLGVYSSNEFVPMSFVLSEPKGFIDALGIGFYRTWDALEKTVSGVKKLIFREVSFKNVGGPIAIGKVASDSYEVGLSYFFKIMAFISVNLSVINLFPIPVLDGGHIMFIIFEIFNRGPLSRKKLEMAQRFGLSLLLLLIFAAIFNDITRLLR
ncbi:MAG: RIP metalloprotease RseP [Oligoflexia bacterium]|nr:RIP metalloprotease RseP [Oligoflexia bacterium]